MSNKTLPSNCFESSTWIWDEQNKLNSISHPSGMGTLEIGNSKDDQLINNVLWDYQMAMLSEVNEAMENIYWKHWSKEAKEGLRFGLINQDKDATGEGTLQNLRLELIDCLFFLVSFLQTANVSSGTWINTWGDDLIWSKYIHEHELLTDNKERNKLIINNLMLMLSSMTFRDFHVKLPNYLIEAFVLAGMNWEDALNLYNQKLQVNYQRQLRGRKQVNDELSDSENANIK